MTLHVYQVGETVALAPHAGVGLTPSATYKIARTLPELGTELQYRVKGDHERFERVVGEAQIIILQPSPSRADERRAARVDDGSERRSRTPNSWLSHSFGVGQG
jgi:hypothetical protein